MQIEHDPNEKPGKDDGMTGGQVGSAIAIGVMLWYMRGGELPPLDWRDYAAFATLGLLLTWLLWPSRRAVDADRHQGADKGIAFRLGKSLNRVFRRRHL